MTDRNKLLADRILQASEDTFLLAQKVLDLTKLEVEAGPEAESRVRDIESHLYYAAHSCESIRRYCTKEPKS